MKVDGKAALITGGGTGIGAATAVALAGQGCSVAVNYSRSQEAAEAIAAQAQALGVQALAIRGDVAQDDDCRAMVTTAVDALGGLDILVNSAGTTAHAQLDDLEALDAQDWHRVYGVNTIGPWQMMRAAAPHLRANGGGEVINVSSIAGIAAIGSSLAYGASKAALNNLTIGMARVLAPEVRVNAVAPGFVTGRWWAEGQGQEAHDLLRDTLAQSTPLKGVCAPEDIAASIMGLINGSDLTTAQIVVIDGGHLIKT